MNKKEQEKLKQTKKQEKLKRKESRKLSSGKKSFEDMIAYVDENGMITDAPPDPTRLTKIDVDDIAISTPRKDETEETVNTGMVDYYNKEKGFGFIKESDGLIKYFFHINNAPSSIAEGQKVTFEKARGQKGMDAINITII